MRASIIICLMMTMAFSTALAQKVTFYASHPAVGGKSPGHIWVGFSYQGEISKKGFYQDGLRSEQSRQADLSYSYDVSPAQYRAAKQAMDRFDDSNYSLGSRDCRAFAETVALAIGLIPPAWSIASPAEWLGQLVGGD